MDDESEAIVRRAWESLAEAGVKSAMLDAGYRPHVSLGVCEELDVEGLAKELSTFAENVSPFALTLSSVGLFPSSKSVIFLGVTPTQRLLDVNGAFHQFFGKYAKSQRDYHAGSWVPHCTLAFDLPDGMLSKAIEVCRRIPLPIHSRIQEIGIAEVSPLSARLLSLFNLGSDEVKTVKADGAAAVLTTQDTSYRADG